MYFFWCGFKICVAETKLTCHLFSWFPCVLHQAPEHELTPVTGANQRQGKVKCAAEIQGYLISDVYYTVYFSVGKISFSHVCTLIILFIFFIIHFLAKQEIKIWYPIFLLPKPQHFCMWLGTFIWSNFTVPAPFVFLLQKIILIFNGEKKKDLFHMNDLFTSSC